MNLMLIKKFFNIIITLNEMISIKMMRLHLKLIIMIEKVLYIAEYS